MKKLLTALVIAISTLAAFPSFAGQWLADENGWWYQNDDGSYPANQWQEIHGKQYYFNQDGYYMQTNTTTPDEKQVEADDTLTKSATAIPTVVNYSIDSITTALLVNDYVYHTSWGNTYHIFEVTNNSPYTIRLNINETAKDAHGNIVGASSVNQEDIPSGCTVFINNTFLDTPSAELFDTTFQVKEETSYIPVIHNITVQTTELKNKVIISATNMNNVSSQFTEATVLFFNNGKLVDYDTNYLTDGDYEIKPGATISEQVSTYEEYDSIKVHITGRKSKWDF